MPEPSILDAHLAEIDRRLQAIQSALGPPPSAVPPALPSGAAPPVPPPEPPPLPPLPPAGPMPEASGVRLVAAAPLESEVDEDHEASELVLRLRELVEAHEQMLASGRELLAGCADARERAPIAPVRSVAPTPGASSPGLVSVSVGPFTSFEALRRFERTLSALPEVGEVALREYAGEDRAVVEVRLAEPTS